MTITRFTPPRSAAGVLFVLAAFVTAAACGPPRPVFPPGAPVPDAAAVGWWESATAACRSAASFSAEITVGGRIGDEKLRHTTLQGAMTRDGRIRLVAPAPIGAPGFVLAGRADRATLTLPRDKRVLAAPAGDIVEALIGLKLAPADWVDILSGCVSGATPASGGRVGGAAVLDAAGHRLLLIRSGDRWRLSAGERAEATIEYRAFDGSWPAALRIRGRADAAVPIDISMTVAQIFVNTDLSPRTFEADVPDGYDAMSLDDLRAIGPLGDRSGRGGAQLP